jgi:uncharacterized membrane protein
MRASLIALSSCLLLAACNPSAGDTPPSPVPPADAPPARPSPASMPAGPDFSKDINAVGTEPFWAVDIRSEDLKLSGPDRKDVVAAHMGAAIQGDSAVWEGKAPDGSALKITLTSEACSDGMSDLSYPYKARVETTGELLMGCAAPVDAWPNQPDAP